MDHNPFLAYLETHADAPPEALRELFRALAKRTHPDLGATDADRFIRLQEHYHEALGRLLEPDTGGHEPRRAVLTALYRYKAHLPRIELDDRELPEACRRAFARAVDEARRYSGRAESALRAFDEQFHRHRAQIARYPDVRTKYVCFVRALSGFFDYQFMPNDFNRRVTESYLAEIRPVTNIDPLASPSMRHNRSAEARSALYRMRGWLEHELEQPACELV